MNKEGDYFWNTFRAQKIIAQWIVNGYDFIDITSGENWAPCTEPGEADKNPDKYIPFWYEYEPDAVERLAEFLHLMGYKDFKDGKWIK
jgi:hypothetical protein